MSPEPSFTPLQEFSRILRISPFVRSFVRSFVHLANACRLRFESRHAVVRRLSTRVPFLVFLCHLLAAAGARRQASKAPAGDTRSWFSRFHAFHARPLVKRDSLVSPNGFSLLSFFFFVLQQIFRVARISKLRTISQRRLRRATPCFRCRRSRTFSSNARSREPLVSSNDEARNRR